MNASFVLESLSQINPNPQIDPIAQLMRSLAYRMCFGQDNTQIRVLSTLVTITTYKYLSFSAPLIPNSHLNSGITNP